MRSNRTTSYAPIRRLITLAASQAIARAQDYRIPNDDTPEYDGRNHNSNDAVANSFVGIVPIIRRLIIISAFGIAVLTSSATMYGLLYLAVMPSHQVTETLFFDYTGLAKHPSPVCIEEEEEKVQSTTASSYRPSPEQLQSAPWAAVDLFAKHTSWEAFETVVVPSPVIKDGNGLLKPGKSHYIEVALALPESEINLMTGMFGVYVELQSSNGTKLALSTRAARLPHESHGVAMIRKVVLLIPLLLGALRESKTIVVPSFRHVVESSEQPLRYVTVRIIMPSRAAMPNSKPLEIISGEIRIGEELNDFQELLKVWFFTCYTIGTLCFCVVHLLVWLIGRICFNAHNRDELNEEPPCDLDMDGSQLEDDFVDGHGQWETLSNRSQRVDERETGGPRVSETSQQEPRTTIQSADPQQSVPSSPSIADEADVSMEEEPMLDMTDMIPESLSPPERVHELPDRGGLTRSLRAALRIPVPNSSEAFRQGDEPIHAPIFPDTTDKPIVEVSQDQHFPSELHVTNEDATLQEAESSSCKSPIETADMYDTWLASQSEAISTGSERALQTGDAMPQSANSGDIPPQRGDGSGLSDWNSVDSDSSPLSTQDTYEIWLAKQIEQRDKSRPEDGGEAPRTQSSAIEHVQVDGGAVARNNPPSLLDQPHTENQNTCPSSCLVQ